MHFLVPFAFHYSADQEVSCCWMWRFITLSHRVPSLYCLTPVHISTTYLFKNRPPNWAFSLKFSNQNSVCILCSSSNVEGGDYMIKYSNFVVVKHLSQFLFTLYHTNFKMPLCRGPQFWAHVAVLPAHIND